MTTVTATDAPETANKGWVVLVGPEEFGLLASLGLAAWAVWLALRWFARDGSTCWPSVDTIGDVIHTQQRAVRYALAKLESAGMLRREIQRGKPTLYHLLTPATSCLPTNGRAASFGMQPRQVLVDTPASFGMQPRQEVAAKVSLMKSTKEVNGRGPARQRFVPPEVDQVEAYCASRGNGIDAEHFVTFYQARGWKLSNGLSMADWKAAIVTWEKRNKQQSADANGHKADEDVEYKTR